MMSCGLPIQNIPVDFTNCLSPCRMLVSLAKNSSSRSGLADRSGHHTTESLQQEATNHRRHAIERDQLLRDMRRLPGSECFLLHKEFSQLCASVHSGPVVFLNAAKTRCNALIILADVDHVIHAPLSHFTPGQLKDLQSFLNNLVDHARAVPHDDGEGHLMLPFIHVGL